MVKFLYALSYTVYARNSSPADVHGQLKASKYQVGRMFFQLNYSPKKKKQISTRKPPYSKKFQINIPFKIVRRKKNTYFNPNPELQVYNK